MSAGTIPWSLFDDRWIDGAADPSHADTAPANETRHNEREENGEEPRGRGLTANGAWTVTSPGCETEAWLWTAVRPPRQGKTAPGQGAAAPGPPPGGGNRDRVIDLDVGCRFREGDRIFGDLPGELEWASLRADDESAAHPGLVAWPRSGGIGGARRRERGTLNPRRTSSACSRTPATQASGGSGGHLSPVSGWGPRT